MQTDFWGSVSCALKESKSATLNNYLMGWDQIGWDGIRFIVVTKNVISKFDAIINRSFDNVTPLPSGTFPKSHPIW